MAVTTKTSSGVQELIDRIRDQGVQAAQEEADRLLRNARKQATEIVAQAKAEAEAAQAKARADMEAYGAASLDALRLAARDTVLDLKARVMSRFEDFVKRLVVSATRDKELVRSIVLVLAGHAADEFIKDKEIEVRISNSLLEGQTDPVLKEKGKLAILGLSSDMLREGLELVSDSDVEGGARVRLVQDKLEIDLSDRAVARMISQRLRLLKPAHADQLARAQSLLRWRPDRLLGKTDAAQVAEHAAVMASPLERSLREYVVFRMDQQTLLAALRRKRDGLASADGSAPWGAGRWVRHVRQHWDKPDFRLALLYPWLPQAGDFLAAGDARGLERLLMDVAWRRLDRHAEQNTFGFEAVFSYFFRWDILRAWLACDADKGKTRFRDLIDQVTHVEHN